MPYKPNDAKLLEEDLTFKVALQGPGGNGKTFSGLTFPNVTVLNFDNNLQAFAGHKDITQVPFYLDSFVDKIIKRGPTIDTDAKRTFYRPNRRDALLIWLNEHGSKFTPDQTILLDSWSKAQDAFDIQQGYETHYTQKGTVDEFAFWAYKQDWSRDILDVLGSLDCNVVVTFHEQRLTDTKGNLVDGKFIPLQQGKFVNRISLYFSDWMRCYFFPRETPLAAIPFPAVEYLHIKDGQLKEDLGLWQTKSTIYCDCKSRILDCPMFIRANYEELLSLYKKSKRPLNIK